MQNDIINSLFNGKNIEGFFLDLVFNCFNYLENNKIKRLKNKADGTPISQADIEIDKILFNGLSKLNNKIPIISEERIYSNNNFLFECYWLIDPIDGTREFISGGTEFTINVCLIFHGQPILGLIAHPPKKKVWLCFDNNLLISDKRGNLNSIVKSNFIFKTPTVITSKYTDSETNNFIDNILEKNVIKLSSSLKFCYLVEGKACLYPRLSVIKKWDIAAGHALIKSVGGTMIKKNGKEYTYDYNKDNSLPFLATNSRDTLKNINFNIPITKYFS